MKELSQNSYQVYNRGELNASDLQILSHLYQPILGATGFSLYMTLYGEGMLTKKLPGSSTHYRLSFMTGLDKEALEYAIHTLEGIGLLNSYKSESNEYIYEILMPLPAKRFYKNELLCQLLLQTLGKNDYEKSKYYFLSPKIDRNKYTLSNHSFTDVFDVNLNQTKVLVSKEEYTNNLAREPELDYDLDLFFMQLSDYQIPMSLFTSDVRKMISHLGTLYHIDPITMRDLVYNVYENGSLSLSDLKKSCQRYYDYHHQSEANPSRTKVSQPEIKTTSEKEKKIMQLNSLSCYDFLTALNNNKKPTKRDLDLIDDVMTSQKFSSGVMNVLIETVVTLNDGGLPRNHVEYLASLFSRKKVTTVKDAIKEAKAYMKDKKSAKVEIKKNMPTSEVEIQEVSQSEVDALLLEIKNMNKKG